MINVHNSAARDSAVGALVAVGVLVALGIAVVWAVTRANVDAFDPDDEEVSEPESEQLAVYTPDQMDEAFNAGRMVERTLCLAAHGASDG